MFNQSNSSFQIWRIVSHVWLNSAKELVSFISNSYITHWIARTLISTIFPENFSISDLWMLMAEIPRCTAPGSPWDELHFWLFLLLSKPVSCTTVDTAVLSHEMPAHRNLQMWCRAPPCLPTHVPRHLASHVPCHFAGQCWLTVRACSATLGPSKPPWVPQSTFSKLFQERRPLTDSLKPC